ncbi:TPA: hypothetical protein ACGO6N_002464, partial [Streptococcus suis]
NNYQIGNFGIFPKGKINPTRAKSPYNDFFDLALSVIWDLYDGTLTPDDDFKKAVLDEKEYFDQFEDFETFISENFLSAFFDEEGYLIRLSEIDSFEEYVRISNQIIYKRGMSIVQYLRNLYDIDNTSSLDTLEEPLNIHLNPYDEALKTLEIVEGEIERIDNLEREYDEVSLKNQIHQQVSTSKKIHGLI